VFSKARIEALSDGLFAIVLTLLVLEIKAPAGIPHGRLAAELLRDAPAWFSFAFTFFLGAVFWVDQHRVLHALSELTKPSLILNFVFLGFVSVLPFSTSLWGHYIREPLALQIYFSNELAIAIALLLQLEVAIRRGEVKEGADTGPIRFRLAAMCAIMALTVLATMFLPVNYYAYATMGAIVVTRLIRRRWKKQRQLAKAHGELVR